MTDKDIETRAQVAFHDLLSAGNRASADAVDNLLKAWSRDRTRNEKLVKSINDADGLLDKTEAELKKVGQILGWSSGTDMVAALYPSVKALAMKVEELNGHGTGSASIPTRPSQGALDTAFEAMATRLEEVLDENAKLAAQVDSGQPQWTTSLGAVNS